jgi:predicted PurR-regulated permease PerM
MFILILVAIVPCAGIFINTLLEKLEDLDSRIKNYEKYISKLNNTIRDKKRVEKSNLKKSDIKCAIIAARETLSDKKIPTLTKSTIHVVATDEKDN